MNWLLAAAVPGLAAGFSSSTALANAYGIAVAGDMLATTALLSVVALGLWKLSVIVVAAIGLPLCLLDLVFVGSNLHKVPEGGWFPLMTAAAFLTLSLLWRKGKAALLGRRNEQAVGLDVFLADLSGSMRPRSHRAPQATLLARKVWSRPHCRSTYATMGCCTSGSCC